MKQPHDMLGYRLSYAQQRIERLVTEILRQHCVERGKSYVVTPVQWGLLATLYESDVQTIGMVAQKLGFDPASLTGIIQRLEKSELVERVHDSTDRRIVNVSLTDEGRDITRSLETVIVQINMWLLPEDQRDVLLQLLNNLIAHISTGMPQIEKIVNVLPDQSNS